MKQVTATFHVHTYVEYAMGYPLFYMQPENSHSSLFALPYWTFHGEIAQFEGYLIYHAHNKTYHPDKLKKVYFEALEKRSLAGYADKIKPFPYNPIPQDKVEQAMLRLIAKNSKVDIDKPSIYI